MSALRGPGEPPFVGFATRAAAAFWLSVLEAREPLAAEAPAGASSTRWVGPTRVPLVLESGVAARDLAALSAVFAFWGRPTLTFAADASLASRSGEPLLAG